ncbi:tyrosine-type recombinase/integrase [Caulobacter sp. KR2-114]|uniref:tyrosine-type recombinase/integrase n=1 Tax=Caulobacter sp. KR2-114 TaxID=3400912 RepID=UPI003C06A4B2
MIGIGVARRTPKLTKTLVDDLAADDREKIVWDSELKGFGVRVRPGGVKTYVVQYRNADGLTRRMALGKHGALVPDKARKLALKQLGAVAGGNDPTSERKARRAGKTVSEICDWYLAEASAGRLLVRTRKPIKATTVKNDRTRIEAHIRPLLGGRALRTLTLGDIETMPAKIAAGTTKAGRRRSGRGANTKGGPGVAGRTVATLRMILGHFKRWQLIEHNPALGVRQIASKKRTRRLSEEEIVALGVAMREVDTLGESRVGLAAVTLMLMTGFRRGEALGLRYAWLGSNCVHFADTKAGPQTRVIGKAVSALVQSQKRSDEQVFVFRATEQRRI